MSAVQAFEDAFPSVLGPQGLKTEICESASVSGDICANRRVEARSSQQQDA